jgi:hypothetical protein
LNGPGRAVFQDYAPEAGGVGMPADAHRVITIGAADRAGRPQPDSAAGPPHGQELLPKPDLLEYDGVGLEGVAGAHGASVATAFAAGLAASALSGGAPQLKFLESVQTRPGAVLRAPQR